MNVVNDVDGFFAAVSVAQKAYKMFHSLKKARAQFDGSKPMV